MCQQLELNQHNNQAQTKSTNKMKPSYSIKQVLKALLFKKQQKRKQKHQNHAKICNSLESLESLDNLRNSQMEQTYEEIIENNANEKLAANMFNDHDDEQHDIYVPVRFARTEAGTFFWTTNLQPVTSTIVPAADEDLLQPAYCYSNYQHPYMQFQDRWAQA